MAIDRGGLQYQIVVEDQFAKNLDAFVNGLKTAKTEMLELTGAATSLKGVAAAISTVASAVNKSNAAQKGSGKAAKQALSEQEEALKKYEQRLRRLRVEQEIANLDQANGSILASRKAVAVAKLSEEERKLQRILSQRTLGQRVLNAAQQKSIELTTQEKIKLGLLNAEQAALYQSKKKLADLQAVAGNAAVQEAKAQAAALQAQITATQRLRKEEILRSKGLAPSGAPLPQQNSGFLANLKAGNLKEAVAAVPVLGQITKALGGSTEAANKASFTFRRLFGILAAFTVARAAINGFRGLVSELIRYNANIEQATLGVASLFLAVGDVRDATGEATTATQGLALAQKEAVRQMGLLRRDSLETAGTFEDLLGAFQTAVAPGLRAGLNVDEIRKFTVQISKAAASIGLDQNQLAEEVRSILSGTISARNTRIAVSLGISNEDIRNAKEAGVLMQFLNTKFESFNESGKESLKTFNALFSNLQEAVQQVLQSGGIEFFDSLKVSLKDLFDFLINQDPITGLLTPEPRAVEIVKAFGSALSDALRSAKNAVTGLDVNEIVGAAKTLAGSIAGAIRIASALIVGFVKGLGDVGAVARSVLSLFGSRTLFDNEALTQSIQLLGRGLAIVLAIVATTSILQLLIGTISLLLGAAVSGVRVLALGFVGVLKVVGLINAGIFAMSAPIAAIVIGIGLFVAAAAAGAELLREWLSEVTGVEVKFVTLVKLLKNGLVNGFKLFILSAQTGFNVFVDSVFAGILFLVRETGSKAADIVISLLNLLGKVSDTAAQAAKEVKEFQTQTNKVFDTKIDEKAKAVLAAAAEFAKQKKELETEIAVGGLSILNNANQDQTIADLLKSGFDKGLAAIKGPFGEFFKNLVPPDFAAAIADPMKAGAAEAQGLVQAFEQMPGIIGTVTDGLRGNADLIKQFREDLRESNVELRTGAEAIGLGGDALRLRQLALEATKRLSRETVFLATEEKGLQVQKIGLLAQVRQNEARILNLNEKQREQVEIGEKNLRAIADLERQRAAVANQAVLARVKANDALASGFKDQAEASFIDEAQQKEILRVIESRISLLKQSTDAALKGSNLDAEQQNQVVTAILARLKLSGELKIVDEQTNNLAKDRLEVDANINRILSDRLALAAAEATFAAQRATEEIAVDKIRADAALKEEASTNNAQRRLILAQAEVDAARAQAAISEGQRAREREDLDRLIQQRKDYLDTLEQSRAAVKAGSDEEIALLDSIQAGNREVNALAESRAAIEERNAAATALELAQIKALAIEAEKARKQLEEPVTFGFTEGFLEFQRQATDVFTKVKDIMVNGLQDLSSVISSSIVDAFDPSSDETFQERFRKFLLSFAEQIINMLVQIAIVKAALGLGFLGSGGSIGGASGVGFAKGGLVDSPFRRAKGFARGGDTNLGAGASGRVVSGGKLTGVSSLIDKIRPPSLDPRDRIPIWARKGEFVLVPEAVKKMGMDVANMLNSLQFDPLALRAIMGVAKRSNSSNRVNRQGFAVGGPVTGSTSKSVSAPQSSQTNAVPVVFADEPLMQRILNGGPNAMLDFLRNNRDQFMAGDRQR